MSERRIGDVTALIQAVQEQDRDGLSQLLHPQFEFHALIGAVEQRVYAGTDGMLTFLGDMNSTWDGYRIELFDFRDAGDCAVAVMRISGTAKASGLPLDQYLAQIVTWRDGKVSRVVAYADPADAFRAAGLQE